MHLIYLHVTYCKTLLCNLFLSYSHLNVQNVQENLQQTRYTDFLAGSTVVMTPVSAAALAAVSHLKEKSLTWAISLEPNVLGL
jgi:hypothetical protein